MPTRTLRVPGTQLSYEVCGAGPVLLVSQSGEGDAGRTIDLVDQLTADYTVVTYDRRGLSRSTLDDQGKANFDFFIRNDFSAIVHDTLDITALKTTATRIIPAVGRTTPGNVFDHRCAHELAALVGAMVEEFPGGHNGNLTHPRAYACRLLDLL